MTKMTERQYEQGVRGSHLCRHNTGGGAEESGCRRTGETRGNEAMDRETEETEGQVFTGEESTPLWADRDLLEGGDRHRGLGEGLGTPATSTTP